MLPPDVYTNYFELYLPIFAVRVARKTSYKLLPLMEEHTHVCRLIAISYHF